MSYSSFFYSSHISLFVSYMPVLLNSTGII
jgi:hypothetical protein